MKARLPENYRNNNVQNMLKKAQKMQEDMSKLQEDLNSKEYTVYAGGGAAKIIINGELKIKEISLSPEIIDKDDIDTLTDILTALVNEAIETVNKTNSQEMSKITGDINVNGLNI